MKKTTTITAAILSAGLVLTGCVRSEVPTDDGYISEGTDTACEITGYSDYSGTHSDMFLKEGDRIAVISPSSLPSREQTDATIEGLRSWGYEPVEGNHVCQPGRTLEDCRADLEWALEDPEIKAIFCVRGGYASSEVMDSMLISELADSEKLIIGFSDITTYHSGWTTAGLPSVHGSMSGAFSLPEDCSEAEQNMIRGKIPSYRCEGSSFDHQGSAEGLLIGGNLATFDSVLNTAYDCTKLGKPYILFLEDVGENYAHIHRYITVLDHAGVLENAAGIVFGEWTEMSADDTSNDGLSRGGKFGSVAEMIDRQFLADADIPVAYGFPAGHGDVNYPLLMGETAQLNVSADSYTLEWK